MIPIAEDEICLVDLMETVQRRKFHSADRDEYDYADSIVIHCDGNSYDTEMFMDSDYYGGCLTDISDPDTERENMAVSGNNGRRTVKISQFLN